MAEDYSAVIRDFLTDDQVATTRVTPPGNPDAAAKALQASKIIAVPPVVAQGDPAFWAEQARQKQAREAIVGSPQLTRWLASDPMAALLANDDTPELANLATKIPEAAPVDPNSFFSSIGRGWSATEHHRAVADAAMGIGELPPPLIPTPLLPVAPPTGALARIKDTLGSFIGSTASMGLHALPGAAGGAAIGGGVGFAAGGPPGALVGALGGAGRGLALGFAADMALTAGGSTYEETGTYRDSDGNPLSEEARKFAALAAGTGTAALATLLPGVGKPALDAGKALVQETVAQAIPRVAAEIGKIGLKGGLLNGAFTAVQTIPEEIAKLAASGNFETVVNDPQARQEFIERHVEAVVDGVLLFGSLGGLAKGAGAGRRALANMGATQLDSAVHAAQGTKLKTRSPDTLMEFVRNGTKEDIGISSTADPEALAKIASPEAIQRAHETGGDVHIPLAEYVAKVDEATHAALRDDIRHTPDGMTLREAGEQPPPAAEAPPSAAAEAPVPGERLTMAEEQPTPQRYTTEADHETPGQFVAKDETGNVVGVGDSPAAAVQAAQQREAATAAPALREAPEPRVSTLSDTLQTLAEQEAAAPTMQERLGGTREAELAQTRSSLYLDPLLKEPLPGMSEADFERYSRLLEAQAARAAVTREPLPEARAEIEAKVDRRRDVRALAALTESEELRLNPGDVSPRQLPNLPKEVLREGGMHPDDVAPTLGYRSGAELVRELAKVDREALIRREIDRLSYGDSINRALNSKQLDVLIAETRALGGPALTREALRAEALAQFEKMPLKEATKREATLRLVARNGQLAESALLRNDMAAALVAKQRQAVAFEMARLQRGLEKEVAAFDRLADRYASQQIVAGRNSEYTDHIHSMLASLGRHINRNPAELRATLDSHGGKSLEDFIREKTSAGRIIEDPGGLPVHLPFEQWSVEDFRQLHDVLTSLDENSKNESLVGKAAKKIALQTVVANIRANAADRMERIEITPDASKGIASGMRYLDATNIKMERLFDWLDKRDPYGPLNANVFRPLKDGEHLKSELSKEAADAFMAIDDRQVRKTMGERVDNPFIFDGRPMKLTRGNMLAMALNWGTKSNRDKLVRGYGLDEAAVADWLNRNMTEAEWKFVRGIWDVFARFWDRSDGVVRRMSGVGMEKVEGLPIDTPFGQVKGDYFPVAYDPNLSNIGELQGFDRNPALLNPLPTRGFTKKRTGVAQPLRLDFDSVGHRLNEILHAIAYSEPLADANKILGHREVRDAINRSYGPEYTQQIRPWLNNIANRGKTGDDGLAWYEKLSREGRLNANTLLIGVRWTTAVVHGLSALSNSIAEAGPTYFAPAVYDFLRHPTRMNELWNWANEVSPEVRNRRANFDRDVSEVLNRWQAAGPPRGLRSVRQKFHLYAMALVATLDKLSAVPTFIAGYRRGIDMGMSEADAIYLGEKTLRNAHGSGGAPDLSAVLRGAEGWKWFTRFMTYFNHNYNQVRDIAGHQYPEAFRQFGMGNLRAGTDRFVAAVGASMAYLLFPAIVHEAVKHGFGLDESPVVWLARAVIGQVTSSLPFVRDVAQAALHGQGVTGSIKATGSLDKLFDTMWKPVDDAMHALDIKQGPVSADWVKHLVAAPGAYLGLSTEQLGGAGQFLWDLHTGRQYANDPVDWYRGLVYGKSHPKPQPQH